jgi:hypothetical protein
MNAAPKPVMRHVLQDESLANLLHTFDLYWVSSVEARVAMLRALIRF